MAFFVYLFVLLVAAGSVIFGMDLTQSPLRPPAYATPPAQTTTTTPPVSAPARISVAAKAPAHVTPSTAAPASTTAEASTGKTIDKTTDTRAADARAEASVQEAHDTQARPPVTDVATNAANHCAIDACSAAYHSFRASDCTYQPYNGGRRLCTKTASSKRVATARASVHHASHRDLRRAYDRTYAERDDRDGYGQQRRGWAFDLFGDAFGR